MKICNTIVRQVRVSQALGLSINGPELQEMSGTHDTTTERQIATAAMGNISVPVPATLMHETLGTFPGFEHEITVTQQYAPYVTRCRTVPLSRREAVNNEVRAMVCVAKKNGGVRITSDLAPLNKYIVPDRHPLLRIEEILLQLHADNMFFQKSTCEKATITSC